MNGTPSTKMGGISSNTLHYGDKNKYFRYYRISFPCGKRGYPQGIVHAPQAMGQVLHDIYFAESENGPNVISNSTVITSNIWAKATVESWKTDRLLNEDISTLYIAIPHSMRTTVTVDIGHPINLYSYSLCLRNNIAGWIIEGSNDSRNWSMINDILPYKENDLRGLVSAVQWYSVVVANGGRLRVKEDRGYIYWGIFFGSPSQMWLDPNTALSGSNINEIAFLSELGGVDLTIGGSANRYITPYGNTLADNVFDKSTVTAVYMTPGTGASYKHITPIRAKAVSIAAGDILSSRPMEFVIMCSDNKYNWVHVKTINTPISTWDPNSVSTEEFSL